MSVLSVPSPVLAKRHFDEGDAGDNFDRQLSGKRSRQHYSPAAARCVQFAVGGLHAVPQTTLSALLALFPGMDERIVSSVLSECGNNIDAAIRRLGELHLSTTEDGSADSAGRASASAAPAGLHRTAGESSSPFPGTPSTLGSATGAAAAPATAAGTAALGGASAAAADAAAGASGSSGGPTTAEQWVDLLVSEMSAATDMSDARQRAAGFLSQFEAFVARFVRQQQQQQQQQPQQQQFQQQQQAAGCPTEESLCVQAVGGSGGEPAAAAAAAATLAARAAKLAEENAVLKKAVQIQHRQLQERAVQDGEVAQLKALLAQYQEQVRTLQVSNYSLTLHLQKATSSGMMGQSRNPDVF
ncbi:hypothetical protein VOLCADRAFT_83946 [Volvox carteri f. nagariensis]|uniref:CUE domain-containing protein n=1 Tax=Volvox carteri f. nagariensis TaxID=3068 RepID=D8UEN2_VOLCA|nr:uncharacterized protein VOLCADRAFT_83946 [Volvox carteri f. nagariensis]EFJ41765.1 hypothetical protein VOLCADRAFT_83946 [Volvox carteri f. nagariensis]|eukprot:XP_002957111.1 hypothetical protein VOLCADRAFT_83946 [Volvox carteri f. nagariensis]